MYDGKLDSLIITMKNKKTFSPTPRGAQGFFLALSSRVTPGGTCAHSP